MKNNLNNARRWKILMKKHQNQDIVKSWNNQFFNYFLIRILIRKSNHQNQDISKR